MIKKIYLFFLIVLVLVTSPLLIRYLLIDQKISILNRIYFNFPGIITREKRCPNYDALLNTTLDNSFSVSIINNKGTLISSYNDEMPRLPASNQKLFSSAYVLSKFKLNNNLKTSLLKKNNNYYLVGQGDPDLNYEDIIDLISNVEENKNINFNILEIDSKFEKNSHENSTNMHQIKERISIIDRAQQNISQLSENVMDLKNVLHNTTKRGRFGEILLENLIKDTLPKEYYEFQKTLSNKSRVDCMIKVSGSLNKLCIDSKFPKESYDKMLKATTKDEKIKSSKMFKLDISNHILEVKKKYIIPGETSDIALIFIPSEQIYIEIFNLFPDITDYFYDSKIFLISPTTLWMFSMERSL